MGAIDLSAYLWPDVDQGRLPQTARVRINRDNALGKRVAYYCPLGTDLVDAVKQKAATNNGSTLALSPTGPERNFVPGSSQYITLPSADLVSGYPLTVAGEVNVVSTDIAGYVLYSLCGTTYKAIFGCGYTDGKWLINQSSTSNGLGWNASTGRQRFLCIHRNGSSDLYINGVLQSKLDVAAHWGEPAAGNHAIGQRLNGSTPRYFSGSAKDFTVFNGELSPAEIASYFAYPRQFLIPENTAIYAPPPPAAGTLGASGSAVASGTAAINSGSTLSASGGDVATGGAAIAAQVNLAADGWASASGSAAFGTAVVIISPSDRGTLDLANCSVTPNGSTPTIAVKNRWFTGDNSTGARFCYFRVTGVNGLTPVFDVDRTNFESYTLSSHFKWSYTGSIGTWNDFTTTTTVTGPDVFRSSNASAFTQDSVYISLNYPWPIAYTRPWIETLLASGYVSMPPSSAGNDYVFATRTATTDGATSGVGNVIAAQPIHSFRIYNGTANAPDGNPKQHVLLLAGAHAAEDIGNYNLKGAVEFILSADAKAVVLRDWFIFDCYPNEAPAGRAGGGTRSDFEDLAKAQDVNRAWNLTSLETITKHKTAIQSDAGSTVAAVFDFHGTHVGGVNAQFIWDDTGFSSYVSKWMAKISVYRPSISTTHMTAAGYAGTNAWYGATAKGSHYNLIPEGQYWIDYSQSSAESFGADFMRALSDLAADNEFAATTLAASGTVQVSGSAALAVSVPIAGAGAVVATGGANGRVTVNLAAAGLAQASATAGLSSQVLLAGSGAALASGNATLAALLNALASGSAQASGTATINGGAPVGTLQANGLEVASGSAQLRVTVYLAASGGAVSGGSATISGPPLSSLSGAGGALSTGGATAAVSVSLTADAFVRAMGTGALSFTFDGELLQPGPLAWRAVETPRYYTVREARAA